MEKKRQKTESEIEMSELRKAVTQLAQNYSELLKIMNELLTLARPMIEASIKRFEDIEKKKNN